MHAAEACVGPYFNVNDCLNEYAPAYPCAFANINLTGTPFTLVTSSFAGETMRTYYNSSI